MSAIKIKEVIQLDIQDSFNDKASMSDVYGFNHKQQISKGFLTNEYAVQFKLSDTPIRFWKPMLQSKIVC